jgi:rRNA maturation endonuclease Nob1
MTDIESVTFVTLLRCACGDKEVTESWVPADMCGRCGMPLRRVEVERRTS